MLIIYKFIIIYQTVYQNIRGPLDGAGIFLGHQFTSRRIPISEGTSKDLTMNVSRKSNQSKKKTKKQKTKNSRWYDGEGNECEVKKRKRV